MTVTDQQLRALAFITKACRPNGARRWDEAGILAALEQVKDRQLAEVIMATIRAASDRDCETPGVIPAQGSHWAESSSVAVHVVRVTPAANRCGVCSKSRERCPRERVADDVHEFEAPGPKPSTDVPRVVAALKDNLAPTAPTPEPSGLDALAARRPELIEAAERIAENCPGLAVPARVEPSEGVAG